MKSTVILFLRRKVYIDILGTRYFLLYRRRDVLLPRNWKWFFCEGKRMSIKRFGKVNKAWAAVALRCECIPWDAIYTNASEEGLWIARKYATTCYICVQQTKRRLLTDSLGLRKISDADDDDDDNDKELVRTQKRPFRNGKDCECLSTRM